MSILVDVAVIGAGPGGYIAAIKSAQLGLNVACIDNWCDIAGDPALGGTCTNVGCIPSKALLESAAHFYNIKHKVAEHGIEVGGVSVNLDLMQKRKNNIITKTNEGIWFLFKKNGISFYHGTATFTGRTKDGYELKVLGKNEQLLICKHVIIATGSTPRPFPSLQFDENLILSNKGALSLERVPNRLGIIGAGVIGLELGSLWQRLGSRVTLLEAQHTLLATADRQVSREAMKQLIASGLVIHTGVKIKKVRTINKQVTVEYNDLEKTNQKVIFDRLIVAIGRTPRTAELSLDKINVQCDEKGFIVVNDKCQTNVPQIWAIGDVVRGPMLAHKAEEEAIAVANRIVGKYGYVNYNTIPSVVYTHPEIAWVGKTEQDLEREERGYRAGVFPFTANSRARSMGETVGFVKVLADLKTDEVLGVHMIGPMVSELIAEVVLAMSYKASSEDIAQICHAHPTLTEAIREAALGTNGRFLNY